MIQSLLERKGKDAILMDTFLKKLIVGGSILAVLLIPCVTPLHRSEAEELPVFTREQSTEAQNLETLCLR